MADESTLYSALNTPDRYQGRTLDWNPAQATVDLPQDADIVSVPDWYEVGDGENAVLHQPLKVTVRDGGQATIYGPNNTDQPPTIVYLLGDARATTFGRVDILAVDQSQVTSFGEYNAVLRDHANGTFFNRGKFLAQGNSEFAAFDSVTGSVLNMASGRLDDAASAWVTDLGQVYLDSNFTEVTARQNATVVVTERAVPPGDVSVLPRITARGSTTIQHPAYLDPTEFRTNNPAVQFKVIGSEPAPTQGYQLGGSPAQDAALPNGPAPQDLPGADTVVPPVTPAAGGVPGAASVPPMAPPMAAAGGGIPEEYLITADSPTTDTGAEQDTASTVTYAGDPTAPPISPVNADTSDTIFGTGTDPDGTVVEWRPITGGVPATQAEADAARGVTSN